jgi:hypothetical protein
LRGEREFDIGAKRIGNATVSRVISLDVAQAPQATQSSECSPARYLWAVLLARIYEILVPA